MSEYNNIIVTAQLYSFILRIIFNIIKDPL